MWKMFKTHRKYGLFRGFFTVEKSKTPSFPKFTHSFQQFVKLQIITKIFVYSAIFYFALDRNYGIIIYRFLKGIIQIMIIEENSTDIILKDVEYLSLPLTLDCGECFRWEEQKDGSWSGVAFGRFLNIKNTAKGEFTLKNTSRKDFDKIWYSYFDFGRDYVSVCKKLKQDSLLSETIDCYYGIRILNQDPWEALVSFVISQQNNIKRIKGIIKRLCDTYGEEIYEGWHSFPTAETLSQLSIADFEALGAGYRSKYLKKLAEDVAQGNINLAEIKAMPLAEARKALLNIYGVGIKVADCALLFGFQFTECFPVDVWMKRVLAYYPNGLPECFKGCEGIAQQYLFHWARNHLK